MKPHATFLQLAAMAMDEPLSRSDGGRLEQHLGGCTTCAREVARLRWDAQEFGALAVAPLPARRSDEILGAVLHREGGASPLRLLVVAGFVGLLLVGSLAVGSELLRRDDGLPAPLPAPTATALVARSPSPSPSPGFVLREGTATGGCDAIGLEYQSLTWRIDPAADEAVTAVTNKGDTLVTSWAPGFTAGTADERVIRDPAGVVVVSDGDTLHVGDRLNGYFVCLGPQHLFVFTQDPQ